MKTCHHERSSVLRQHEIRRNESGSSEFLYKNIKRTICKNVCATAFLLCKIVDFNLKAPARKIIGLVKCCQNKALNLTMTEDQGNEGVLQQIS